MVEINLTPNELSFIMAIMNSWEHTHKHDIEGVNTVNEIIQKIYKAWTKPVRKDGGQEDAD